MGGDSAQAGRLRHGHVALVTGAARGIGASISLDFIKRGCSVCFCDINDTNGKETEAQLRASLIGDAKVAYKRCDVRDEKQIQELVNFTITEFGRLDYLVNNVAIHFGHKSVDEAPISEARAIFEVNVISQFAFIKYALPELRRNRGSIVNMASISALLGQPGGDAYAASKGAVVSFTKSLAIDEAAYHVRVNCVSPSITETVAVVDSLKSLPNSDKVLDQLNNCQLFGRCLQPQEVSNAVVWLALDAEFITGTDLLVSGGAELGFGDKSRIGVKPNAPIALKSS